MNTNLSTYSYDHFKPNFDSVELKDLVKPKQISSTHPKLKGYVLPKRFAKRLSEHLGYADIAFPYRDVPLTNRNILESHIFTRCVLLENSEEMYNALLPIFDKIQVWGEKAERPTSYKFFSNYLRLDVLKYCEDRIRYIPRLSNPSVIDILNACGVTHRHLLKNILDVIDTTVNFKYAGNAVNFLKPLIRFNLSHGKIVMSTYGNRGYSDVTLEASTKSHGNILRFLYRLYVNQYRQWFDDGSWITVGEDHVYVDHHTVYEIGDFNKLLKEHQVYPNQLPFGIHPSIYFKDRIQHIAITSHSTSMKVQYPKQFTAFLDLSNSPHRQLITGLDLVNEGVRMKHCVGGINYQDQIKDGSTLFFHLDVPTEPYGATLSMEKAWRQDGSYRVGNQWWRVDQYYGFDDKPMKHGIGKDILDDFLNTYFTPYTSKTIKDISRIEGKHKHETVYVVGFHASILKHIEDVEFQKQHVAYKNTRGSLPDFSLSHMPDSHVVDDSYLATLRLHLDRHRDTTIGEGFYPTAMRIAGDSHRTPRGHDYFNMWTTRYSEVTQRKYHKRTEVLRPINLVPNNDLKLAVHVNGCLVSHYTHSASVIIPPGGRLTAHTSHPNGIIKFQREGQPSAEKLPYGGTYVNTQGKPQHIVLWVCGKLNPKTIATNINATLNDTFNEEEYDFRIKRGGIIDLYHNSQSMGRALR